jgi:hypothetical protein
MQATVFSAPPLSPPQPSRNSRASVSFEADRIGARSSSSVSLLPAARRTLALSRFSSGWPLIVKPAGSSIQPGISSALGVSMRIDTG